MDGGWTMFKLIFGGIPGVIKAPFRWAGKLFKKYVTARILEIYNKFVTFEKQIEENTKIIDILRRSMEYQRIDMGKLQGRCESRMEAIKAELLHELSQDMNRKYCTFFFESQVRQGYFFDRRKAERRKEERRDDTLNDLGIQSYLPDGQERRSEGWDRRQRDRRLS